MRPLPLLVVLAVFAAPGAFGAEPPPEDEAVRPGLKPEVLARVKEAVVFVQVNAAPAAGREDAEDPEGSGSGFFIAPDGRVATSWHVVASRGRPGAPGGGAGPLQVIMRSGARDQQTLPARLLAVDVENDLAVLKVEAEGCATLPLGEAGRLVETAPLWVAGFPLGRVFSVLQRGPEMSINSGRVSSLRHNDLGRLEQVQFDAAVVPGNSGGPVFTPDGRAVGVARAALGVSRVNFAVPAERLKKLLEECPPDRKVGKGCALEVASEPAGAEVYLDSALVGKTPLKAAAEGGWRRLVVSAPQRRSWARSLCVYDGRRVEARLEPLAVTALKVAPRGAAPAAGGAALKRGAELFRQDFAEARAADAWDQDIGGGGKERSWYVQDGELRQFSDDGVLHAVFAGDPAWTDYSFAAKVRIRANARDGRAGLIFRSGDDGFALFRLHRETSKVQLAWHGTRPFGWQVFEERTLPFKVKADAWYRLEVQALGKEVVCLVDDKVVLEAAMEQPLGGRVGFYSVDAQAAFDDAAVCKVEAGERPAGPAGGPPAALRSFWFTEPFEGDHGFWQPLSKGAAAPPWNFVPGECLPPEPPAERAANLLARYDIHDFAASSTVTWRSGVVGLVFRREGDRHYLFTIDPAGDKCRLLLVEKDQEKELGASSRPAAVRRALAPGRRGGAGGEEAEGGEPAPGAEAEAASAGTETFALFVSAQGGKLRAGVNGTVLVEADDASLTHGQLGFWADKARAVFHRLDVNSGGP